MNDMSIDQLFRIAIQREMEANGFYSKVAQKASDAGTRSIFLQLAEEEMGHMELLERFRADPTLEMKIAAPSTDFRIAESIDAASPTTEMKPKDAIALAMKNEQLAMEFYRGMAALAKDAATKGMFENLENMESGHKHRLETMFVDIGYPEAF